jgi:hypothetical protein
MSVTTVTVTNDEWDAPPPCDHCWHDKTRDDCKERMWNKNMVEVCCKCGATHR